MNSVKRLASILLVVALLFSMSSVVYATGSPSDIVAIANAEVGTTSGDTYKKWYYGKSNNLAWCATFVSWCANKAGVPTSVIPKEAGVKDMYDGVLERGGVEVSSPQTGDLVFYLKKNSSGQITAYYHVAIMTDATNSVHGNVGVTLKDAAGNEKTGNYWVRKIKVKNFSKGTPYYVRPNYSGADIIIPPPPTTSSKVTFNSVKVNNIKETSATPYATISYTSARPSEVGIYLGTSTNNMQRVDFDNTTNLSKNPFNAWYDLSSLERGTDYYCYFYVKTSSGTVNSPLQKFTTGGTMPQIAVSSVSIDISGICIDAGKTIKLTASVSPANATNRTVTWSSSNTAVATVDNNGVVTGKNAGYVTITAAAGGKTATSDIEVIVPSSVTFSSLGVRNLTSTNAEPYCTISYTGARPSEVGLYLRREDGGVIQKVASDTINHNKNPFEAYYDLNAEAGEYLRPGNQYYYKFYAIVNGVEYSSDVYDFIAPVEGKPEKSTLAFHNVSASLSGNRLRVNGTVTSNYNITTVRFGYNYGYQYIGSDGVEYGGSYGVLISSFFDINSKSFNMSAIADRINSKIAETLKEFPGAKINSVQFLSAVTAFDESGAAITITIPVT